MKFLRSSRGRVIAGIALVLVLFLVRPGAQRLRTRIVRSISLALGRPVDVGSVSLRLLPQPGFDLENFVVHEDPEFGAEPVLQSSDVVATVRVSSLLRGRLEIARLNLTEPSINLVRNGQGRWNLERLIERTASTSVAPTAKGKSEARPAFPYIEADRSRINLKLEQEKEPYTLTEATFAWWQDSENTWGVRLKAQPMRTDFNLSDTGVLTVEGSWQRSASLHETPVKLALQWEGAQLGQASKLALGQDKGWRGSVRVIATLSGTPRDLTLQSEGVIEDFRRFDISGERALRLAAHCAAHYSSADHVFSAVACRAPVGDGVIALSGSVSPMAGARTYNLTMLAQKIPLQPLVEFARRVKKDLPRDMVAAGRLDGNFTLRHTAADATGPVWQGSGEVLALSLRSPLTNTRLAPDKIPFTVSAGGNPALHRVSTGVHNPATAPGMETRLDVGPFNVALGGATNAVVRGQFSRSGYSFLMQGGAEVQRLLEVARTLGLPAPQPAANGEAQISLRADGKWAGFAAATVTGTAQLHSVTARLSALNEPLEIESASLELTPNSTAVRRLTATAAGNTWHGSLTVPRKCAAPHACPILFDLHTDEFATDELSSLVNQTPSDQPWYHFQSPQTKARPYLANLHAIGKLTANRVLIHNLAASRVSAEIELEQGRLQLSNLHADVLGGRHAGQWQVDFTVNPPAYRGVGTVEKLALGQIADAMHDPWVTGTASVEYHAKTVGWTRAELLSHADADFQIEARDGSLPHLTLSGESDPLRVNRFVGHLLLRDQRFEVEQGKLQTPGGIYQLTGTASPGRILDMKLVRDGARGVSITGTLDQPRVEISTTPETQAALKRSR